VKAFAKRVEEKPKIYEAEAIGLLESLKWLSNTQTNIIETDCLHVVHCLNNKTNIILNLAVLLSCVKTYFC
jgi:ABC-type transport system involved in Fe-S cluster assembly fused permease/ATPase subunit